jgi:hypothetical protein
VITVHHITGQDIHDRTGQGMTGHDRAGQDRTGQDRTGQDRTGQDRTGQDRTGQDRTGQDRTGQDIPAARHHSSILAWCMGVVCVRACTHFSCSTSASSCTTLSAAAWAPPASAPLLGPPPVAASWSIWRCSSPARTSVEPHADTAVVLWYGAAYCVCRQTQGRWVGG